MMFAIFFHERKISLKEFLLKNRYYKALLFTIGEKVEALFQGKSIVCRLLLLENSTLYFKNFMKFHCCKLVNPSSSTPARRPSSFEDAKCTKSVLILGSEWVMVYHYTPKSGPTLNSRLRLRPLLRRTHLASNTRQ